MIDISNLVLTMYPKCTPKCTLNVPSSRNSFSFTPKKGHNHAYRAILEPFTSFSITFSPFYITF